jgi:tetratricopeptide (TPR) repeat protein
MPKHDCTAPRDADEDFSIARRSLKEGDVPHAAVHLGCALAAEPLREAFLGYVPTLAGAIDDPLALVPLEDEVHLSAVVLRVRLLAHLGQYVDALRLLLQASLAAPERPFIAWAEAPWLDAASSLTATEQAAFCACWVGAFPGTQIADPAEREAFRLAVPLIERFCGLHPDDSDLVLFMASVHRKLGELEKAQDRAVRAHQLSPSWRSCVALAMVHSASDRLEEAVSWYQRALTFDPTDLSVRLDLADLLCDHGEVEQGLRWYDEVLAREPDHPWAFPYSAFWRAQSDVKWVPKLLEFARTHPDNEDAAQLAERFEAYIGFLPDPDDDAVLAMLQLLERLDEHSDEVLPKVVQLESDSPVVPSARLAFERGLARAGHSLQLEVVRKSVSSASSSESESESEFEPEQTSSRRADGDPAFTLWSEGEAVPKSRFAPPPSWLAEALSELASYRFQLNGWYSLAEPIAQRNPGVSELLGAMVHPPDPPEGAPWHVWLQRVQVASAMVMARLGPGWVGSERRRALTALVLGPTDWSVTAAIVALSAIAMHEPAAEADVHELFGQALARAPREGRGGYLRALLECWLRFPDLSPEMRERLGDKLEALLRG